MKKISILSILCICSFLAYSQATFQSATSGNWANAATWTLVSGTDANGVPDGDDDVTVMNTHTVSITATTTFFKTLLIQSTGVLRGPSSGTGIRLGAKGNMTVLGSVTGRINLYIQSNCTFDATAPYTALGTWYIQAGTLNITSNTTISKPAGTIIFQNTSQRRVINNGTVTLGAINMNNAACTWSNSANSNLTLTTGGVSTIGVLSATSIPNTVTYNSTTGNTIKNTSYYNLTLNSASTKTMVASLNVLNNLTLGAGAILNANNFTVNVGGNWVNNSSSTAVTNQNVINFNGTAAQSITGSQPTAFRNLSLSNSAGLTANAGVTISNELTVNNGNFNSNGNVTLLSDASNTARIAPVGATGSFSGNMTVQKFISGRVKGWHDLSTPISNTTILDWDNEMYMSGFGDCDCPVGISGTDGSALGFASVYRYNEPTGTYVAITNSLTPLVVGRGYEIWMADDQINWAAKTINAIGVPSFGTQTVSCSFSGPVASRGSNLIGNPFASAIDFALCTKTNVSGIVQVRDDSGNLVVLGSGIIPAHQGFWVTATGAGASVSFSETAKSAILTTNHYRTIPNYGIKLLFSSPTTPYYHENTINFEPNTSLGYDSEYDAQFIKSPLNEAPSIFMKNELGQTFILNTISGEEEEVIIPMSIYTPVDGTYYIQPSILNDNDYKRIWLEDTKNGKKYDLREGSVAIEGSENTENNDYVLHLSKKIKDTEIAQTQFSSDLFIFNTSSDLKIKANSQDHQISKIHIYSVSGQLIYIVENVSIEKGNTNSIDISTLSPGIYIVNIIDSSNNSITKKIIK